MTPSLMTSNPAAQPWERSERWDLVRSALEGSSYYQLLRFFQGCTGKVGLKP